MLRIEDVWFPPSLHLGGVAGVIATILTGSRSYVYPSPCRFSSIFGLLKSGVHRQALFEEGAHPALAIAC